MLTFLNIFFDILHSGVLVFVVIGWIPPSWRKWHRIFLAVVLFSWLVVGTALGTIGYCFLTDWHWDVKRELGETRLPSSYTQYIFNNWFNLGFGRKVSNWITAIGLVGPVLISILFWFNEKRQ